jgi:ABC-2 type transport system permease protein
VRAALVIAAKDLRQRFRDRSAIVLVFVAPVLIATLMSFAFSGSTHFHVTVGYVDADHGVLSRAFADGLRDPDLRQILTVRRVASVAEARHAVDRRALNAAYVIPSGFSAAVSGGAPRPVTVLGRIDDEVSSEVARSIAESFVAQVNADRLSVATAVAAGAPPAKIAELVHAAGGLRLPEQARAAPMGAHPLKAISYYAPSMAIFFMLFAVGFGARSFFGERDEGTLDRIAAAPVRPATILVGKALSTFVYSVAGLATMAVVTSLIFHARWGDPVAAATICVAMALAVVSLTMLAIAVSRTERQAEGIASVMVFGLALLGGNFIFVSAEPALMRRLSLLTPNGWALRAFTDLGTGTGHLGTAWTPLVAIAAFALLVGGTAAWLARRMVVA